MRLARFMSLYPDFSPYICVRSKTAMLKYPTQNSVEMYSLQNLLFFKLSFNKIIWNGKGLAQIQSSEICLTDFIETNGIDTF